MSYMIYMEKSSFFIKKDDLLEITLLLDKYPKVALNCGIESDFDNILGIFNDLGFIIKFDTEGNINDIFLKDDIYLRCQEDFFKLIAHLVKNGSFIEFIGEDGTRWRWIFKDSKFSTIYPKLVWDM